MLGVTGLKFDGDLQVSLAVETLVYLPKSSLIQLAYDLVVLPNLFWDLRHNF